jgi:uncharacterized protein with HEPN domain
MREIIKENILSIIESIELIEERFLTITQPEDMISSNHGVLILDAISMRLQVVGELLQKIDKIDNHLFQKYPEIEWQQIMRLRDIISHHYETIDYEIIFDICENHILKLKEKLLEIIQHTG